MTPAEKKPLLLGLLGNPTKKELGRVLPEYIDWLNEHGIQFLLSTEFSELAGLVAYEKLLPSAIADRADILLSFGGDGTFLNTIHNLEDREVPVLGVNIGGLGYLTAVGREELFDRTLDLMNGEWEIERRMRLEARVEEMPNLGPWYALNEVIVDKGGYSRMIRLNTTIDGEFLNDYRADGIIVATPTGSTGYNLSAGGPIIEPKMAGILFVPLNPHSLSNRPLLVADDKTVRIVANTEFDHVVINVDGRVATNLPGGCTLVVRRAESDACLVNFKGRYFYQVLRQKLRWGE